MYYKILLTLFLMAFISACSTTPKDTADSSGSGSSGDFNTATTSEDGTDGTAVDTTTSDFSGIIGGTPEDFIVSVGDRVFFGYDSAELDSDAKELLQAQAAWLKQYSKTSITIEGHCDERGTREYNLALGERRAQAVKNYLNGLGVGISNMSTISYGKERPAVVGSNDDAWSQNRRSVTKVN
jgi:peptidoglycan-associated lipoprotein